MAVADGTMDCDSVVVCTARWSALLDGHTWEVEMAWCMQVNFVMVAFLSWWPSCHGGIGSLFGGHCRQRNSYRTPPPDFSCQFVCFVCVQLSVVFFCVCTKHALMV